MSKQPSGVFGERVWASQNGDASKLLLFLRGVMTTVEGAVSDRIWARAGHMTYLSLLYLVPLGALALALSSRLGGERFLIHWLQERLSPTAPDLAANLISAMNRLNIVTVGYVGLVVIVVAGIFAVSQLEDDFSTIWRARTQRFWWQRILFYPLAILIFPTLAGILLALGAAAEARTKLWIANLAELGQVGHWLYNRLIDLPLIFHLLPYVLTWLMLTALYYLTTSAPVRFRSAVVGGLFAGTVWQIVQKAYIGFQFGTSTYREIWGYLAQIPLLLLWLYFTWFIVLLGAEVVFAWQYRRAFQPKWPMPQNLPRSLLEKAVVETARSALNATLRSSPPGVTSVKISADHRIPWPVIEFVANRLTALGLLTCRRTAAGYKYAGTPKLRKLTVGKLLHAFHDDGEARGFDLNEKLVGPQPTDTQAKRRASEP